VRAARRYFLTAEVFDAAEAHRIGLLTLLVSPAELDAEIQKLLEHLLAGGPEAMKTIKRLIRDVAGRALGDALIADTAERIAGIRASAEGREGIASFLEKRKPSWSSKKS
jgi:methylglutaconyl-CoA hydratase